MGDFPPLKEPDKPWLEHYPAGVPARLSYPAVPVFAFLSEKAQKIPERACTLYKGQAISYQQMDSLSNALAQALVELGLKKGDRVTLCLPNLPQFVLAFYGVLKAGGVISAMNPAYKEAEVLYQLKDSGAVMVICLEGSLPLFQSIQVQTAVKTIILTRVEDAFQLLSPASRSQMPVTHRMVTQKNEIVSQTTLAMTFGSNKGGGVVWLTSLLPQYWGATRPEVEVGPDDPAIFQYSGGTTGTPKAAAALHRNLVANMLQFSAWLAPMRSEQDAMLAAIPLFHVFGMVIAMGVAVLFEAAIVLVPNPRDLADLLANIDQNRVTIFPTVPNLLFSINQFLSKEGSAYDLSSLRLCISGSAPLLKPVKERFEQLTRARVVEGYGLSEAPTALTCNPVLGENRTGSIGLPLPDVDCRIVSLEDGQTVLGQGKTGELIALSPQLMAGYHNQPEATCLALRGGWLYTGDVAFIDAQGYFYLVDRKKDLIKVGGLQVWPREVEEAIATHPKVLEVGVTGVMHPGYGETVKAWVVARAGENLSAEEVVAWCKDRLAEYKAPRKVAFLSQLPRSAVGKVLRRELGKLDADKS